MSDLIHPDIDRAMRVGSRPFKDVKIYVCAYCKDTASEEYDDLCIDFAGQTFCCEDCFKDYYGFRSVSE